MKNKKCVVFDFSKGKRVGTTYSRCLYGQLDLDLNVEVMSPEPAYGGNVLEFKKMNKKKKNSSSGLETEEPFFIA
jgi:hypothetical protein